MLFSTGHTQEEKTLLKNGPNWIDLWEYPCGILLVANCIEGARPMEDGVIPRQVAWAVEER